MASIQKRKLKNNKVTSKATAYDVRYRNPSGKQVKETFYTYKEAEQRKAEIERELFSGSWIDPKMQQSKFFDLARMWQQSNSQKRIATKKLDEGHLRNHINPVLGEQKICSIAPMHIQSFIEDLVDKQLSVETIKRIYNIVKAIFNFAVVQDYIIKSPCRRINLPKAKKQESAVLNHKELKHLVSCFDAEYQMMVLLAGILGLRYGEVAGLRIGDINFTQNELTVAGQLSRYEDRGSYLSPPKTDSSYRVIPINNALTKSLKAHIEATGRTLFDKEEMLFITNAGNPVHYSNFRKRVWLPTVKTAGFEQLKFHDLRKTATTIMISNNFDVKSVQKILGHSSATVTLDIYAQSSEKVMRESLSRIIDEVI